MDKNQKDKNLHNQQNLQNTKGGGQALKEKEQQRTGTPSTQNLHNPKGQQNPREGQYQHDASHKNPSDRNPSDRNEGNKGSQNNPKGNQYNPKGK